MGYGLVARLAREALAVAGSPSRLPLSGCPGLLVELSPGLDSCSDVDG